MVYAVTQEKFEAEWAAVKRGWANRYPAMIKYLREGWLTPSWRPLWPSYNRTAAALRKTTTNGCESFFSVAKYQLLHGTRLNSLREVMKRVHGIPTDAASQAPAACYVNLRGITRQQVLDGSVTLARRRELASMEAKVLALLKQWRFVAAARPGASTAQAATRQRVAARCPHHDAWA